MVECWDGTMAQDSSLCPEKPAPEPVGCPEDAKVCPDGSVLTREGPDCKFPECPVVESVEAKPVEGVAEAAKLPSHGEYARPAEREERRDERVDEGAKRLGIKRAEDIESGFTLDATGTEDIFVFDELCELCTLKAKVKIVSEGPKAAFGLVMKYRDGADSPKFMFERWSGNISRYHAAYGETYNTRRSSIPAEFDLAIDISRDTVEVRVNNERKIRRDSVGPLATGKGFGIVAKDARIVLSDVVYKNWQ